MAGKHLEEPKEFPHWAEVSKEIAAAYDRQTKAMDHLGKHRKEGDAN